MQEDASASIAIEGQEQRSETQPLANLPPPMPPWLVSKIDREDERERQRQRWMNMEISTFSCNETTSQQYPDPSTFG